jgi:hypothetical protein
MRDRRPRGISDDRPRHRAHRAQNDGARDSAHRGTTGSTLSLCFERNQRRCDRRRNQQYPHRDFPVSPSGPDPEIEAARRSLPRCRTWAGAGSKSPRPISRRGLKAFDGEGMPVICPTCQIPLQTLQTTWNSQGNDPNCESECGAKLETRRQSPVGDFGSPTETFIVWATDVLIRSTASSGLHDRGSSFRIQKTPTDAAAIARPGTGHRRRR